MLNLQKRLTPLVKEANTSAEHDRLQAVLGTWASARGFRDEVEDFPTPLQPDVLRANGTALFIGDAKNAENERPSHTSTRVRFARYLRELEGRLARGDVRGGVVAVATNDGEAAGEWREALYTWLILAGICGEDLKPIPFQVEQVDAGTWVVFG